MANGPVQLIVLSSGPRSGPCRSPPVAIAVITAYLAVSGSGPLTAIADRGRKPAAAGGKAGH